MTQHQHPYDLLSVRARTTIFPSRERLAVWGRGGRRILGDVASANRRMGELRIESHRVNPF